MTLDPVRKSTLVIIALSGVVAAGCSSQETATMPNAPSSVASGGGSGSSSGGNNGIQSIGPAANGTPVAGQIKICKAGNEGGTFNVSVVSGAASVVGTGHAIAAGTCEVVAETTNSATGATVSVTETPSADLQAVTLVNLTRDPVPFSNGGSIFVNNASGFSARFFDAAPDSHGCGPGYWKQSQHFDSWPLSPNIDAGVAFGLSSGAAGFTLLEGLEMKGGNGAHQDLPAALVRQAIAALLNAKANINYPLIADPPTATVLSVGQIVRNAANSGAGVVVDFATSLFEKLNNNFSCPLN